ncbi:hypothetical protein LAZ67_9001555 [Cordylochernes scorpioides]|uniref:Uncharacterized protein n=1 Tax=Cordylochernes scorpioides TaxID=51811 RepID=A0ABY6KT23_9ARAC|nr:hypothetical protein LAZ67_9001555 [Cordylochernes scorpioides]
MGEEMENMYRWFPLKEFLSSESMSESYKNLFLQAHASEDSPELRYWNSRLEEKSRKTNPSFVHVQLRQHILPLDLLSP